MFWDVILCYWGSFSSPFVRIFEVVCPGTVTEGRQKRYDCPEPTGKEMSEKVSENLLLSVSCLWLSYFGHD